MSLKGSHGPTPALATRYNVRLHPVLRPEPWAAWKEIMPTDIIMPQMGESIVEGTITKWLKKPGDKVQRDEPLFEISTDKVDAEIPAPASGILQEIKVTEGTTVGVNTVVGTIAVDGEAAAPAKAPVAEKPAARVDVKKAEEKAAAPAVPPPSASAPAAHEEEEEARSSPLVRKIAREHGVSLSQISGTGLGGRINKQDLMPFGGSQTSPHPPPTPPTHPPKPAAAAPAPRP